MTKYYLLISYLFLFILNTYSEGTKEFRPQESHKGELCIDTTRNKFCSVIAPDEYRLHIHISNFTNEAIYFGFGETKHNDGAATFRFYRPDNTIDTSGSVPTATGTRGYIDSWAQAVAGPSAVAGATGYWALRCTPDVNGDYYLAFKITWGGGPGNDNYKTWANFDVTVVNTTTWQAIPGRVWSEAWQLYSEVPTQGSSNQYWGKMFVYSVDSIVTKCDFNGMIPGTFTVSCNHSGCYPSPPTAATTARKSVSGEHTFPEYKIFLNDPDNVVYPSGTLGGLDTNVAITAERNCDGTVNFTFGCTKAGNVELKLMLSTLGATYTNRIIPQAVTIGLNTVFWDGYDGSAIPKAIPNGSVFNFVISYVNGLTHLPLYDVEFNANGFYLDLIRPTTVPPPPSPLFYWDDSNFSGGTTNLTGCLPNPPVSGCHIWTGNSSGFGNNRTMNTWWYAVSTDSDPVQMTEKRFPANLGVISGMTQLCQGNSYTFSVGADPNSTKYVWTYPGGSDTTLVPSITISIPGSATPGPGTITVQGYNSNCGSGPLSYLYVTINGFPNISLTGPVSVCQGAANVVYTTQSGQNNYLWTFSPGASLVAGGGTSNSFITVNWNGTGSQSISVNYTNPLTGCTASSPYNLTVTVHENPVPVITGENSVCELSTGNVYLTQSGKSNYQWVVSAGGTITGGGTSADNSVTVTWNSAGARSVSVVYTDPLTNCTAVSPTVFNVLVKPLPVPVISGLANPCEGSTGNIYSTSNGMMLYSWIVSPGGSITAGGGSSNSSVTVTWLTSGIQTVSANYTDPVTGCSGAVSTIYNVTVNPLPQPAITGPTSVCVNNPGPVYNTATGQTGYTWNIIPSGTGTITSGAGTSSVAVLWTSTGNHAITVNYTDATTGCTAAQPASYNVTVNTLPVPSLGGESQPCSGLPFEYTTQTGATSYSWNISSGGTVVSGGTINDPTVTVSWNTPGAQSVSVNYTIGTGCQGAQPAVFNVNVHQSTPPEITGLNTVCETNTVNYSTQAGNSGYTWNLSPGGTFVSGTAGSSVTVKWSSAGSRYIEVNFTNSFGCTAPTPTRLNVTVNPLPVSTITAGSEPTCSGTGHSYSTLFDPACTYQWDISPATRGIVSTGQGMNASVINWLTPGAATLQLTATNSSTGCFTVSTFPVTVNPSPEPVFTPCFDVKTTPLAKKFNLKGATPLIANSAVFLGNRVTFNNSTGFYEFDPFGASAGQYPVTFTYSNVYQCSVTTPPVVITVVNSTFSCGGDLTDVRDGKKYKTSLIGSKCWMQDNLNYGSALDQSLPQTDNCSPEKYCLPTDVNCTNYGGLYMWNELMDYGSTSQNQGLCPPDWHIPSEGEWQSLVNAISMGVNPPADGIGGSFLKDSYLNPGFKALTKGVFYLENTWAYTNGTLTGTFYWTSTTSGNGRAIARGVNLPNPSVSKYPGNKSNGFSVRCVKD